VSIPSSTYRIQFSADTTFADGVALLPYLDALGAGALYASPLLESGAGSNHGYDVVDPTRVSGERGGEEERVALVAAVRERGLGFLLDIVPNHVGVDVAAANPWWWDMLAHGRSSRYASYFDIDWDGGPLLLPVLGAEADPADEEKVLVGDLTLSDDRTELRYYEHAFPVAPGTGEEGTAQEVHARQHYRLASWKRGAAELTYRRFFDISTLAAVRVEDPEVFAVTHGEVVRWVEAGQVDGLRVDHPDGLSDPGGYMRRLRAAIGNDRWLLVEKILAVGEELPTSWPVDGTSGYEALREICGVFVDPDGAGLLTQLAAEHTGRKENAHAVEHAARREVADTILAAEVRRIAALVPVPEVPGPSGSPPGAAIPLEQGGHAATPTDRVREAVAELLCGFPVYRSYLPEGRAALDTAVSVAITHRPDLAEVVRTIVAAMLAEPDGELATRVQQTSGMVMAKGVEDTAFYRYNRFVALNEVGGDPERFGVSPAEFHDRCAGRVASWPTTMTTLSTHDTKRSEDVRARLAVLAEIPREWAPRLREWAAAHPLPDPSLDLLAWQSLVGAWPISTNRMAAYLGKAAKEAKLVTSHVDANAEVDAAIAAWPEGVLADAATAAAVEEFVARIDGPGRSNSLGQKLLQIAGPGVPDVYQGTELYEYSLVDPDNRRPVDWALRRELLERLDGGWLPDSSDADVDPDGAVKLLVTSRALRLRRERPDLFAGYRAVAAEGPAAEHAVAFSRSPSLVAVATRLPVGLAERGGWGDTVLPLPDGTAGWTDVLTGAPVDSAAPRLERLLARYPVALLVRSS
jgi:(1->4)-alpha-D-glucan 1-alpha-D-glucosylmutase